MGITDQGKDYISLQELEAERRRQDIEREQEANTLYIMLCSLGEED